MGIGMGLGRPLVSQQFDAFTFAVGVTPLPIQPNATPQQLITTFVISNAVGAVSVFLGGQGVSIGPPATGLEIPGGTMPAFIITQEGRQMYELQAPLLDISAGLNCASKEIAAIPFKVWDLSKVFLVASVAVNVTIAVFPEMFL